MYYLAKFIIQTISLELHITIRPQKQATHNRKGNTEKYLQ